MAIMGPALDRERQRARLRPSVAKRAPLPSTTPTSVICWKKFCERTMDFDFGEDFIDHLEAGDPYGRAGMDRESFPAAAGFNTYSPLPH